MTKTPHQQRVEAFMRLAKQDVPDKPITPSSEVCVLRARLILEEALETIEALGCEVLAERTFSVTKQNVAVVSVKDPDIVEVCDGCADISVVTIGTLSAFGVPDNELLSLVDKNNLEKFGKGHSWRPDGKLVKPPDHQAPKIKEYIFTLQEKKGETKP